MGKHLSFPSRPFYSCITRNAIGEASSSQDLRPIAPGVIMGYERNVATNTMLRKHGI